MVARKALIVGIDYYAHIAQLHGCVHDAQRVNSVLERNGDDTLNFHTNLKCYKDYLTSITRSELKNLVSDLFNCDAEVALLYFSGHGHVESTGGYLCTSDCRTGDDGLALGDVLVMADQSRAKNRLIVLDCCHAGIAGAPPGQQASMLREGTTILTASTAEQYAIEEDGGGVFSGLFVDALNGAAGNLVGDVTPGSVYAHIDQSLGAWTQRPVFKTNVNAFVSLRKVEPPISLNALLRLTEFFPQPDCIFGLDPSFEPEMSGRLAGAVPPNPVNTQKFAILQGYVRVNLVVPVNAKHMWHAAMQSTGCKLTALGKHYRRLVEKHLL